jgi:hypothetical protein
MEKKSALVGLESAQGREIPMPLRYSAQSRIRANDAKMRELILLISEWSQEDRRFGAIKLNKLLFHADFCAYLTFGEPITGQEYFALPQGPAPRRLKPLTEQMKERSEFAWKEVEYFGKPQKRPIALRPPDLSSFSGREVQLVRQTIEKFWHLTATEISDQSHVFLGWKAAHLKETIPYATALVSRRPPSKEEQKRGLRLQERAARHLGAKR